MCPPVSPHKDAFIVKSPHTMHVFFVMETPLRGRSGGHTGTAPTVSFGQITRGRLMVFGWIARGTVNVVWVDCVWVVLFVGWLKRCT